MLSAQDGCKNTQARNSPGLWKDLDWSRSCLLATGEVAEGHQFNFDCEGDILGAG